MQSSYAKRLRQARLNAGISQSELARRVGLKNPQAVQYLEEDSNNAQGSRYTPRFAQELGVSPVWLQSGSGSMVDHRAAEPGAGYYVRPSPAALMKSIRSLTPELQSAISQIVEALAGGRGQRGGVFIPSESGKELSAPQPRKRRAA
jgi:transcriptional regulator with XRE-family HTH domain